MRNSGILPILRGPTTVRLLSLLAWVALTMPWSTAWGQWVTQTNRLKAGWNAVFLHVDPSYATLDTLVGNDLTNPIEEVWYWDPGLPTGQFLDSPQLPTDAGSQWRTWTKLAGPASKLQSLTGNGAYLVKVGSGVANYNWLVKGKPVAPTFRWSLSGLNFIGFPTPPSAPPTFDAFFAPAPGLKQSGEVYRYPGGDLGANNPVRVVGLRTTSVESDEAFWIRAGETYNRYFGPVEIVQSSASGLLFGANQSQAKFRLRNQGNAAIVVTLRQVASELPPAGQSAIQGPPPLLVRGEINTTNLTFGYKKLADGPQQWSLAPAGQVGSEVEVVIGLNRAQMSGPAGSFFAGILRVTDSLGLSQIDLSVSAEQASTAGLWVGGATVSYVSHYLKPYAKATNEAALVDLLQRLQLGQGVGGYRYERDPNSGRVLVFGGPENKAGSYLLDGPIKVDSGTVANPFPLRLIVHNDGSQAKLLQKVFHGIGLASNVVAATQESLLLPSRRSEARRISAIHLPTSDQNIPWTFVGSMQLGASMSVVVPVSYDDQASNPFLHTYHPDHDNLDAQFSTTLPQGLESYGITRRFTLSFKAPADDFTALTVGSQDLEGTYTEVITFAGRGTQTREYNALGSFALKRISDVATLTTQ